jgi:hypothetical protein
MARPRDWLAVVAAPLSTRRRAIYAALTLSYLVVYAFMRFEVVEER